MIISYLACRRPGQRLSLRVLSLAQLALFLELGELCLLGQDLLAALGHAGVHAGGRGCGRAGVRACEGGSSGMRGCAAAMQRGAPGLADMQTRTRWMGCGSRRAKQGRAAGPSSA